MNQLSKFNVSLFSECNTPAECGRLAAQYDDKFDVRLPDEEVVPVYTEFFEREKIVSFSEEEWKEYVEAYQAQVDNMKSA